MLYDYNHQRVYPRDPTYEYSVLSYPDSIRVFVLFAASDSATPIQGDIIEQRLSDSGTQQGYTALSYAWGDQHCTYTIIIGKRQLRIGRNLYSALRNLRRKDRPIRLWVDAICINQDDVNERNHQVQQMRSIYSSAFQTIIYLGSENGSHTEFSAWNFLERHATWAMNINRDRDPGRPAEIEKRTNFRGELPDVEIDVLVRPWFRRLWVFQEVVVSKSLSVQCGSRRISWDDFCKIILLSPRYHDPYGFSLDHTNKIEIVRNMFQARCAYQELYGMGHILPPWRAQVRTYTYNSLNILDLLHRARSLESSDPKNKIFGLLGIASGIDVDHWHFAIDYSQDCRTLYVTFARNIMFATKNYDILSYVDHSFVNTGLLHNHGALPSWVPNWDQSQWANLVPELTRTIISTLDPESEIQKIKNQHTFDRHCYWVDAGERLVTFGEMIGQIKHLGPIITVTRKEEMAFEHINSSHLTCEDKYRRIMKQWYERLRILCNTETDVDSVENKLKRLLGCQPYVEKGTVEYHLQERARKTAPWTQSSLIPSAPIRDKSSIVDGKRIAVYGVYGAGDVKALAIVPNYSHVGDFLIELRGGRVPFAIRVDDWMRHTHDDFPALDFGLLKCKLVGESVINRATAVSSRWCEKVFLID
ncbi:heterokaryon incompatibility protein-domain-containing protein [Xylariaceae sp. FL1651]|nr:heterokaryon incompatibility protein-domain-containing protein [Xylariaceae sp. FL1651]